MIGQNSIWSSKIWVLDHQDRHSNFLINDPVEYQIDQIQRNKVEISWCAVKKWCRRWPEKKSFYVALGFDQSAVYLECPIIIHQNIFYLSFWVKFLSSSSNRSQLERSIISLDIKTPPFHTLHMEWGSDIQDCMQFHKPSSFFSERLFYYIVVFKEIITYLISRQSKDLKRLATEWFL